MRTCCAAIITLALLAGSTVAMAGQSEAASRPSIPSAGCGVADIEPGRHLGIMEVGDLERSWVLQLPTAHDGETPIPLVLGFYGGGDGPDWMIGRFRTLAEEEGFAVVAPKENTEVLHWMYEPEDTEPDFTMDKPDIAFVDALLDRLEEELCLDQARVYATGMSNGAWGALALGCALDDRIAAVAPVGALLDSGEACNQRRPVPLVAVIGTEDEIVFFDGGVAEWFLDSLASDGTRVRDIPWFNWSGHGLPVLDKVAGVASRYGCEPSPTTEPMDHGAERLVWGCPDGADLELVTHGGGHVWETNTGEGATSELVWGFLQQHSMPA